MSENNNMNDVAGNIKISEEVVSTIAGVATMEVKGVAGMYGSIAGDIAQIFGGKKNLSKGVKVAITDNNVVIDLYILVDYGVKIPEIAWEAQDAVKTEVETMTGLNVEKVNVHIEGISIEKDKTPAVAVENNDAPDENETAAETETVETEAVENVQNDEE